MTLSEIIDRIDAAYTGQPRDRALFAQALASADLERVDRAVTWWLEKNPDKPPTPARLLWTARVVLDHDVAMASIAKARAVLRGDAS